MVIAQVSTPKYANEYLALGVGARAYGMGEAFQSVASDVYSGYWNPAGLLGINSDQVQVAAMHTSLFSGIANYDYAGIAARTDSSTVLGFSFIRLGVDDIPDTRFLYDADGSINYDNIRFFSAADYAFIFSVAHIFPKTPNLEFGANVKVLYRNAGDFATAWGFGFDLGVKTSIGNWDLGATLRDATGTYVAWYHETSLLSQVYAQTGNELSEQSLEISPPRLIIGANRRFNIGSENFGIRPSLDLLLTFDGKRNTLISGSFTSVDPYAGLEMDYKNIVFLRAGAGKVQKTKDFDGSESYELTPAAGIGLKIKNLYVDYALTDVGNVSEALYSHVFSLKIDFAIKK
ncbi:hypothetical protein HH304_13225 [Flammeovirgaceae bacterium KN852]|uniref:PorV/PorQ family protein n=2 Tax=Marinigracilibium pacificum TaxID=2729599 RepID=A0A848J0L4_9BACT|nr:hypothetical protein [Marinigracilibium pacificum]